MKEATLTERHKKTNEVMKMNRKIRREIVEVIKLSVFAGERCSLTSSVPWSICKVLCRTTCQLCVLLTFLFLSLNALYILT